MVCLRAKSVRTCRTAPARLVDPRAPGRIGQQPSPAARRRSVLHRPTRGRRRGVRAGRRSAHDRPCARSSSPSSCCLALAAARAGRRRPGGRLAAAARARRRARLRPARRRPTGRVTAASTCSARPGQPVHTALAGTVTYAGLLAGRGVVVVDHGATRTTYEPVTAAVAVGAARRRGATHRHPGARRVALLPARLPALGLDRRARPTSTRSGWSGSARSGCCRSGGTSRWRRVRLGGGLGGTPLAAGPW